ncbi:type I-E CRISPR-associated protein Cas6/Cse3/CasE [Falsiroseomonas sp. CW058]|uniref:type I-E CRISPR-associated protein Cas6/Cse3/CasE n=1 Tax=Falsiroseomonas sp. CW058 TaxID=3388664 RepID=UPI003D3106AF
MTGLILSRARLRGDAPVAALARLLVPADAGDRAVASHRLVWSLFTDGAGRRRDFLWREEGAGSFLALSRRPPNPLDDLFEIESRPFEPVLSAGDQLGFRLRANPVVARKPPGAAPGARGVRHDVVMDALHRLPPSAARAEARPAAVVEAGRGWLDRQGAAHGFEVLGEAGVDGYETLDLAREGGRSIRYGVLEFEGLLRVRDPAAFLAALAAGFGRARAFGCGLMLIRRALWARG